jgi:hypothetical protein
MMARTKRTSQSIKKLLSALALLQLIAWLADIIENYYLLTWIQDPSIGSEFTWYHFIVSVKWIIALSAVLFAVIYLLGKRIRNNRDKTHFFI